APVNANKPIERFRHLSPPARAAAVVAVGQPCTGAHGATPHGTCTTTSPVTAQVSARRSRRRPQTALVTGWPSSQSETSNSRAVEAAGPVDAENAPTAPWKTPRARFPQLPQALSFLTSREENKWYKAAE